MSDVNVEDLTLEEFVSLVKQMRFNQRRYAKNRKPEILETLGPLEKKVDEVISLYHHRQGKLF